MVAVSAKKVFKKISCLCTFKIHLCQPSTGNIIFSNFFNYYSITKCHTLYRRPVLELWNNTKVYLCTNELGDNKQIFLFSTMYGIGSKTSRRKIYSWKNRDIFVPTLKGTVSWDRFQTFWQKFTELGLTKGRGRWLNFLGAPMILKHKKYIYCG